MCGADNIIEFGLSYGEEEITLRTGRTTYYYYYDGVGGRNIFFNSQYFLWCPPSWKSLAIGHKIMGKITGKILLTSARVTDPAPCGET